MNIAANLLVVREKYPVDSLVVVTQLGVKEFGVNWGGRKICA